MAWTAVAAFGLLIVGIALAVFGMFSSNFYLISGAAAIDLSGLVFAVLAFREDQA